MSINVFTDPIPYDSKFTSDKDVAYGIITDLGVAVPIVKATRLSFTRTNNVDIQFYSAEEIGSTYAGKVGVNGSITGMFLDDSMFRLVVGSKGKLMTFDELLANDSFATAVGLDGTYNVRDLKLYCTVDTNKLRGYSTRYVIRNPFFMGFDFNYPMQGPLTQSQNFIAKRVDIENVV